MKSLHRFHLQKYIQSCSWYLPIAPICDERKLWCLCLASLSVFIHWHVNYISPKQNSSSCDCWSYSRTVLNPGSLSSRPLDRQSLPGRLPVCTGCRAVLKPRGIVGQLVAGYRVAGSMCGSASLTYRPASHSHITGFDAEACWPLNGPLFSPLNPLYSPIGVGVTEPPLRTNWSGRDTFGAASVQRSKTCAKWTLIINIL